MKSHTRKIKKVLFSLFLISIIVALHQVWGWCFKRTAIRTVTSFKMHTLDGAHLHLSDFSHRKAIVVVFLGISCPISNAYLPSLKEMSKDYANDGVEFIGINSLNNESIGEMADHAREYEINFRLVKDWDGRIAKILGATRTAEAFLLDPGGRVFYEGRIDDSIEYGARKPHPQNGFLKNDISRVLYQLPPSIKKTDAQGCLLSFPKTSSAGEGEHLTYSRDIRPIVDRHCINCHNPKGMAPFSLTSYDKIKDWAPMIESVVSDRIMPPWHADPRYGEFLGNRSLPEASLRILLAWLRSDMPPGNPDDLVSRVPTATDGWQLGKPDFVVSTPQFKVRPSGASYFENYYHKTTFTEDTWVKSVEVLPGNPKVVHHVTVYVIPPGNNNPLDWDDWGFFAAMAPGYSTTTFPIGYAKKIPAGSTVYVEMHYSPRGKFETDQTQVGFHLAHGRKLKEAHTYGLGSRKFTIPAGASDFRLSERFKFSKNATLFGIYPHGHYRAKSFRLTAELPNGEKSILISVPNYDVAWQNYYKLRQPLQFREGTSLICDAVYDNSNRNPRNPDPLRDVSWGPKTEDEMMYCFIDYAFEGEASEQISVR